MDLSIIIVSFNTKELTLRCVHELDKVLAHTPEVRTEIIIVDNASSDGSGAELPKLHTTHAEYFFIQSGSNVGFSKANNVGLRKSRGRYILYLNSDVMVGVSQNGNINFKDIIEHMDADGTIGALTVRVELPGGEIDKASHRGFPTLWRSLTYFLGLERIVGRWQIANGDLQKQFGGYHLLEKNLSLEHEIEAGTAAFLLCRGEVVRTLKGFDEQFFMYGEDLDLCYRIKQKGYKMIWYPKYTVIHLKYQSGLGSRDKTTKRRIRWHFYDAMAKFYHKYYEKMYPRFVSWCVYLVIGLIKKRYSV